MKLYTEEQVRLLLDLAKLKLNGEIYSKDVLLEQVAPIELPSDEEIGKEMDKLPFSKHVDDGLYNDGQLMGFELGAKWIKEQILNK